MQHAWTANKTVFAASSATNKASANAKNPPRAHCCRRRGQLRGRPAAHGTPTRELGVPKNQSLEQARCL